ncbi:MAG: GGDEF domain-containing protein [Thermoleophilaceae bacterium]|nr:GGDEF domain-containing protein [Thermoleophilaceae bacterium]
MSTVAATSVTDLPLWGLLALSALCGAVIAGGGALVFTRMAERARESENGGDLVTGVADRRRFVERLDADWRAAREGHGGFGLLVVDIDDFAEINQMYGRSTGDRVLMEVAESIRLRVRRDDYVARVDADEFAVICHGVGPDGLESVRRNLEAYVNFASSAPVMLSIGVASPSILDDSSLDVLERARESLAERRSERPVRVVNDALAALLLPH